MSRKTVYFGRFISTPTPDELLIQTGAVLVSSSDGHGLIEKVDWSVNGPDDALSKFGEEALVVTAGEQGFFFPGFIDTHIHASQYPNAGIFGKSTLLDWLTTYTFPLESSFGNEKSPMYANATSPPDPLARAKAVYNRVVSRTLAHGTTTASYYATIHLSATNALADIASDRGQRAYIGRVCMDNSETCPDYYRDESTEETLSATHASIEHCKQLDPTGMLVAPIITPRFAPSCLPSTLSKLAELAREQDLRIQTHISENLNELKLVKSLFPEQNSYAEVYDVHGLLTERTILAHAVHLSAEEMKLVKTRKSKVSHCPASNSALGSGFCPVRTMLDEGIEVGLGTDVSGGHSLSILEAVRQACFVSRHVGFVNNGDSRFNIGIDEGLYLGTMGGAQVIGMDGKLGGFKEGMLWDVQEIELGSVGPEGTAEASDVDVFGWETWEEKVAKWVYNGDDRNVKRVWASKDRGRGLFTTKPVKAGDLILCEKAFAHCYANTKEENLANYSEISLLLNMHTNRMSMGTLSDLITTIVQKLWRNPSYLPEFTVLHHGSYKSVDVTEVDGKPIIDTFLVERIISINVFGCPLSSRESQLESAEAKKNQHHSRGIWLTASSINHACLSNVRRSFIGDLQLVHATRDIAADTEWTFWYHIPTGGRYEETQRGLQGWGFECDCAICLDAKNTPKKLLKRRDALRRDLKTTLLNMSGFDAAKAERLLAAVEQTYKSPPSKVPPLMLWESYLLLARVYAAQKQPVKAVSPALQVLECLGFIIRGAGIPTSSSIPLEIEQWGVMMDCVIEAWIHLSNAYAAVALHMLQKAEEGAEVAYKICVGEEATFGELQRWRDNSQFLQYSSN